MLNVLHAEIHGPDVTIRCSLDDFLALLRERRQPAEAPTAAAAPPIRAIATPSRQPKADKPAKSFAEPKPDSPRADILQLLQKDSLPSSAIIKALPKHTKSAIYSTLHEMKASGELRVVEIEGQIGKSYELNK